MRKRKADEVLEVASKQRKVAFEAPDHWQDGTLISGILISREALEETRVPFSNPIETEENCAARFREQERSFFIEWDKLRGYSGVVCYYPAFMKKIQTQREEESVLRLLNVYNRMVDNASRLPNLSAEVCEMVLLGIRVSILNIQRKQYQEYFWSLSEIDRSLLIEGVWQQLSHFILSVNEFTLEIIGRVEKRTQEILNKITLLTNKYLEQLGSSGYILPKIAGARESMESLFNIGFTLPESISSDTFMTPEELTYLSGLKPVSEELVKCIYYLQYAYIIFLWRGPCKASPTSVKRIGNKALSLVEENALPLQLFCLLTNEFALSIKHKIMTYFNVLMNSSQKANKDAIAHSVSFLIIHPATASVNPHGMFSGLNMPPSSDSVPPENASVAPMAL